jgi:hypothetical protein
MVDGFHWTRVTSKHLRFLYEDITQTPVPAHIRELAERTDRRLAGGAAQPAEGLATGSALPRPDVDAALRNRNSQSDV